MHTLAIVLGCLMVLNSGLSLIAITQDRGHKGLNWAGVILGVVAAVSWFVAAASGQ
jgi:hypothetical protein